MVEEKINKVEKEKAQKKVGAKVTSAGANKVEKEKGGVKVEEKRINVKSKKKVELVKKDKAIANGFSLKISPKQSKYVCRIIRGKSPNVAIARLQAVIDEKRPVPMAGLEVGHKRGRGLAGGKFPKNACRGIMDIVKQAGANAVVAGIENPVIVIARSDRAAAPYRKAGRKAKRCHIYIEIRDRTSAVGKIGATKKAGEGKK